VDKDKSTVRGNYAIIAVSGNEGSQLSGNWNVGFELDEDFGYWFINNIQIEGIKF
jgi:hypothetical protein